MLFTLTVAIDRFVQIRDVMLSDDAGIVVDITAVSVDGMDLYLGPGTLLPQSILATNLARSRSPFPGIIRRQVTITFNVNAAGTVGFNALGGRLQLVSDRAATGQPTRRFQLTPTATGQSFSAAGGRTAPGLGLYRGGPQYGQPRVAATFGCVRGVDLGAASGLVADRIIWPLDFDLNINIAAGGRGVLGS